MTVTTKNYLSGDGSTQDFSFTFQYIDELDIEVALYDATLFKYITQPRSDWALLNPTTIRFTTAPPTGTDNVMIYRSTDVSTIEAEFYPGSAIRSSDLNDNFEQLLFAVQENQTDGSEDTDAISDLEVRVEKNETDIADLDSRVTTNTTNIATNTIDIRTNTDDIVALNSKVTTNQGNIATNTADIAVNTANIATNTTNIATNTADIATNTTNIATNAANIATNTSNIQQLEDNPYTLPIASDVVLGGIKVGNNLTIDGTGVLSADVTSINVKGSADFTAAEPSNPSNGDLYYNTTAGTGVWTGFNGDPVSENDQAIWNNSEWSLLPGGGSGGSTYWELTGSTLSPVADYDVTVAGNIIAKANDNELAKLEPYGVLKLQTDNDAMAAADAVQVTYDNDKVIQLKYDGSATFSGDISINNGSYIRIRTTGDNTSTAIQLAPNGSALFNGSATFAGVVTEKGATIKPSDPSGGIYVRNTDDDDNVATILGDGSAFFTSKVESYGDPLATGGAETGSCMFGGSGFAAAADGDTFPLFRTYKTGETTPTAQINSGGTATFGNDPTTTASNGIKLAGSTGAISARRTADPTNYLFAGYSTVSGNTPVAYISADGSARFEGQTSTISSYAQYSFVTTETTSNTGVFVGSSSQTSPTTSNSKMHFAGDGTANIDGRIYVGSPTTTNAFVRVQRSDSGNVFSGNDATSNTSYITADGSAEFANEIGVGPNYTNSNVNKDGTWISGTGRITFNHSTSQSNTFIRGTKNNGEGGNTEQFAIGDDGSATFASTLQVGGNAINGQGTGVQLYPSGSVQACQSSGSSTVFAGYTEGSTTKTSVISANGDAEFVGTVTAATFDLNSLDPLP